MKWPLLSVITALACQGVEKPDAGAALQFEVSGDRAQLGYDAPFSIAVHAAGAARAPLEIRWRQIEGAPVRDLAVSDGGFRLAARTPRLSDCRPEALPWGVVPLSPRTRGEVVLEAEWSSIDGAPRRERIFVAAAVRSRGLPNVPVDQRIYLGGVGWRVKEAPPESRAEVEDRDGVGTLRPDARGIWQLADGDGRSLRIQAGRYIETPLDCGRASCHGEIARVARSSPMTWALARRLQDRAHHADAGVASSSQDENSCALTCHVTGEAGAHEGGFFDVADELHVPPSLSGVRKVTDLPRALRRLGSVGCLACHGPSALPEAEARWSILRSDVCAHCHDAPPRYGHVVAWQATSMARADRDPRARSDRACTPCHTTWGFLKSLDRAEDEHTADLRMPPPGTGTLGITCSACHAVHDVSRTETSWRLLRAPAMNASFAGVPAGARARSASCILCHSPREGSSLAAASASAVWAGRMGLDPVTGTSLTGPSPHLSIEGGCVGCHREGPDGVELGKNHGFRADRNQCASCHSDAERAAEWEREGARIGRESRDLWNELIAMGAIVRPPPGTTTASSPTPPHAMPFAPRNANTPLGRAAYDLSLLLEDRGFTSHNLPYARILLEKAQNAIQHAFRRDHREPAEPSP